MKQYECRYDSESEAYLIFENGKEVASADYRHINGKFLAHVIMDILKANDSAFVKAGDYDYEVVEVATYRVLRRPSGKPLPVVTVAECDDKESAESYVAALTDNITPVVPFDYQPRKRKAS